MATRTAGKDSDSAGSSGRRRRGGGVLEELFNLRFAISIVTIWGEARLRTH